MTTVLGRIPASLHGPRSDAIAPLDLSKAEQDPVRKSPSAWPFPVCCKQGLRQGQQVSGVPAVQVLKTQQWSPAGQGDRQLEGPASP